MEGTAEEVRAAEAKVLAATATVEVMGWAAVVTAAARAARAADSAAQTQAQSTARTPSSRCFLPHPRTEP